ncbi:MAG: hypothetical protein WEA11_08990 [Acidimicrobiales bacterium]
MASLVGPSPWSDEIAARMVLQNSLAAVVSSLRGDHRSAEASFGLALDPEGGAQVQEAKAVAYSMRAALASEGHPERALLDVERARQIAEANSDPRLAGVASIGEGWALGALGHYEKAAQVLNDAAEQISGELERAVAHLRLAEVYLLMGDRVSARKAVDQARTRFLDADARYWGARSALLTGSIDRDRGARWLKLARKLSLPDPAYERLFQPAGRLRIEPMVSPGVFRDGQPVAFLTRHAEAIVRLLCSADSGGLSGQDCAELFWPEAPQDRQSARLRTLLWQARNSLGADAWRVQRQRNRITFDQTGVDISGSITAEQLATEFSARGATD